ncbi:MAG: Uma2 family endonuclease [Anaerolineae bacterium]|nr:Uma2 family endonuclease [Anaerolineae bacterium]MDQ7035595.1 Uma2 family endonuclease [Anaerolineae bacterium]
MVVQTLPIQTSEKHYTKDQFFDLSRFFDMTYQYELREGLIYKMPPPSMLPSMIAARIIVYIGNYLLEHDIGHLTGADGAYELNNDNTLEPDVGFISYENQALAKETGFVPKAPDLAVEVISPYDSKSQTQDKAEVYLSAGTKLVWIVYPKSETVDVCRLTENKTMKITEMTKDDMLSGEDVLPDFTLAIKNVFAVKKTD